MAIQLSPMLKQFMDLKKKHPNAVLLFRCGDFYETYEDDAVVVSEVLGITLTKSTKTKNADGEPLRMAGFPYHALDMYLHRLIRAGHRVAICDQIEDPKAKTLVKRGVTELVKPAPKYRIKITHRHGDVCEDELIPHEFSDRGTAEEVMRDIEGAKLKDLLVLEYPLSWYYVDKAQKVYEIMYLADGKKFTLTYQVVKQ